MGTKKCCGYFGKCYGSEDMMVPVVMFGKKASGRGGLHNTCKSCMVEVHKVNNPRNNARMPCHPDTHQRKMDWKTAYAKKIYGSIPKPRRNNPRWDECMAEAEEASKSIKWEMWDMDKNRWVKYNADIKRSREELGLTRDEYRDLPIGIRKARERGDNVIQMPARMRGHYTHTVPVEEKFDNKVVWKENTARTRSRDQKVVRNIQRQYDECCIVGCDYPHYDVAHIWALKHDSPDLPTNCWPMCPNHHREFDKGRLDPVFGDEPGNIKLVHEIDFENVTKALVALTEENSSQQGVK